jgi:lipid II:glycine glycyltransferase (peptidoglycan interpeptide bridge formation enzyme)
MKPKGRYNIKKAHKNGVTIKDVKKTSENIQIYYDLMTGTTQRK